MSILRGTRARARPDKCGDPAAAVGSGHDSNRPLAGSHQPDRQRANEPVASLGGRPDDDGLRADLLGDMAELGEWVAAPGHVGDGYAPLLGCLFDLAAQVV